MPSQPTVDDDTAKFRASTLEEAIATAEQSLGGRVSVVEAHRIRRGGIGGFFASDLGVEVTVALENESMDAALERIVNEGKPESADDTTALTTSGFGATMAKASGSTIDVRVDDTIAPVTPLAGLRRPVRPALSDDDVVPAVRADDIIDELRTLADERAAYRRIQEAAEHLHDAAPTVAPAIDTSADVARGRLGSPGRRTKRTEPVAAAPIDTAEASGTAGSEIQAIIAEALADRAVVDRASERPARKRGLGRPSADRFVEHGATPAITPAITPAGPVVASAVAEPVLPTAMEIRAAVETTTIETPAVLIETAMTPESASMTIVPAEEERITAADLEVVTDTPRKPAGAPTRRHVELTIAAADQLIESLSRSGSVQRLSVRVVLRSGDRREVEAEAQWEAAPTEATA